MAMYLEIFISRCCTYMECFFFTLKTKKKAHHSMCSFMSCTTNFIENCFPSIKKSFLCLCVLVKKTDEMLRESACIHFPSPHTLHDYTHCRAGFSAGVDHQLLQAANFRSCPECHKPVVFLDKMHIREDLGYDKSL